MVLPNIKFGKIEYIEMLGDSRGILLRGRTANKPIRTEEERGAHRKAFALPEGWNWVSSSMGNLPSLDVEILIMGNDESILHPELLDLAIEAAKLQGEQGAVDFFNSKKG